MDQLIKNNLDRVERYREILETASPFTILGRGYSYVTGPAGNILKSIDEVSTGDHVSIRLSDGRVEAAITDSVKEVNNGDQETII